MITMIMIMTIDNLIYQWNNEIDLFLHKGKHVFLVISTQVAKSETSKPTPQLAPQCESYSCSHGNTMVTHTGSASFTQRLPLFHSSSNNLTWLKKKSMISMIYIIWLIIQVYDLSMFDHDLSRIYLWLTIICAWWCSLKWWKFSMFFRFQLSFQASLRTTPAGWKGVSRLKRLGFIHQIYI